MFAVYGVLLLALSVLLFVWAYGQFRAPTPKEWTTSGLAANVIVLGVISLLAFGVGMIIKGAVNYGTEAIQAWHLAQIAGIVIVTYFLGRRLGRRSMSTAPLQASTVGTLEGAVAGAANDSDPGRPRPAQGAGRRFGRRRAA